MALKSMQVMCLAMPAPGAWSPLGSRRAALAGRHACVCTPRVGSALLAKLSGCRVLAHGISARWAWPCLAALLLLQRVRPWLLLAVVSRHVTCTARHPATASVDISCVRTWAHPACLVLTLALEATPKVPVTSPRRSLAGRATPKLNRCAGPFLCIVHMWWSSGWTASCQTDHYGGGTREVRQFVILSSPTAISP